MANRRKLTRELLKKHPICCSCGGNTPATTADHVPAKIMFWGKRRPAGLESPACQACNSGTKALEQIAAIFARVSVRDERTPEQRAEFNKIVQRASLAFPGWRRELLPDQSAVDRVAARLDLDRLDAKVAIVGPLLRDAFFAVGAKLALGLHYAHTGKILPPEGAVEVAFETNVPRSNPLPDAWFQGFGPTQMLRQGEWTSDGHFAYRAEWNPDGSCSRFVCHIGEALAFYLFVAAVGDDLPPASGQMRRFRPGDLQTADAVARTRYVAALPATSVSSPVTGSFGFLDGLRKKEPS